MKLKHLFSGNDLGVKSWTALHEVFPNGLENLYSKTGLKVVAHNRYWATDNVNASDNGGSYHFVIENDTKRALPQDDLFWNDFFRGQIYLTSMSLTLNNTPTYLIITMFLNYVNNLYNRPFHL